MVGYGKKSGTDRNEHRRYLKNPGTDTSRCLESRNVRKRRREKRKERETLREREIERERDESILL
jgi:hypothetical protein